MSIKGRFIGEGEGLVGRVELPFMLAEMIATATSSWDYDIQRVLSHRDNSRRLTRRRRDLGSFESPVYFQTPPPGIPNVEDSVLSTVPKRWLLPCWPKIEQSCCSLLTCNSSLDAETLTSWAHGLADLGRSLRLTSTYTGEASSRCT